MSSLLKGLFTALLLALCLPAAGQQYPSKTVRMIISFQPGGITDVVARQLAQKLSENLGQPVIVENRPGGNFIIAADAAAKAEPDGHTLFMAVDSTFTLNPLQSVKLPYDYQKDFAPISLVGLQSLFIVASAKAPGRTLMEVIAAAKANPGKVTFGSSALVAQLIGEQIKQAYGVDMLHVPFKGSPPMLQALLSSDIDFAITTFTPYANYVKEGKLHGLAVTGSARDANAPDSPTLAELGKPELTYRLWFGMFAPAATPKPILQRLNAEFVKVLSDPVIRQRLVSAGVEPMSSSPEEMDGIVKGDLAKWGKLVKAAGIKLQ
jgi:tripartite-type tricarboxylate transporter receptor subunit TctC